MMDSGHGPVSRLDLTHRISGRFPVFEGQENVQCQLRDSQGVADTLIYRGREQDRMPELPFIRK